jgi:nucleotide-binding universal stress UspA family protein
MTQAVRRFGPAFPVPARRTLEAKEVRIMAQPIVVGLDGTAGSLAALDFAAGEAHRRRLPLQLLAASPADAPLPVLGETLRRICTEWPGLTVTGHTPTGDPTEMLLAASRTATLVVVGRRAAEAPPDPRSVSAQIAAHSLCPTIVVPKHAPDSTQAPVLLGLGMSPEDDAATGFAFEEAALRQVPLLAVHVWAGIPAAAVGAISPFAYDVHSAQSAADRMVAAALTGWVEKYPDVTVDRMPLYDVNPGRTLLDASTLAGLVVISAHRFPRLSSQLLGSIARTLIQRATRPVAIVRPIR